MSIEFFIDGRPVTAEAGQTILEVARANGIEIPSLCREKRISKTTSCFVCVVRDKSNGKFIPSCAALPRPGMEIEASTPEVLEMRRTALNLLLSEHTGDCEAPCTLACPAHARVEEYVRAGRQGDFMQALKIIKERIPLPISVGRVCPRFCEKHCRKHVFGDAVAINEFKRLAADLHYDEYMEEIAPDNGLKAAVIGAGPAGLSAAYYLKLRGTDVTVFDAMPKAGGMLRYGIPEYRLPKAKLDQELKHFEKLGIKFQFGRKIGRDVSFEELKNSFDAVVTACGCWKSSGMHCPGEELAVNGIDFLRRIAENGNTAPNPGRVLVVGGGNTAMDCLRSAVRLGGMPVKCLYRRSEQEMPAEKLEIAEAKEEGVEFVTLTAPVKLEKRGGELILTCRKMTLGEPDASGRRRPVEVAGSDFEIACDTVIAAIGQRTTLPEGVAGNRFGYADVPAGSTRFDEKCYAAGDCLSGAATVVEALACGRKAALEILRDLKGEALPQENEVNVSRGEWQNLTKNDIVVLRPGVSNAERNKLDYISLAERKTTFKEVCSTMPAERVMKEGERCIECSCADKKECKLREYGSCYHCRPDAIPGARRPADIDARHPEILQDRGKCIKCGVCIKICKEVMGKTLLGFRSRGFTTNVSTAFDSGLPADCAQCGACVEACPTGALSWRKKA